jgi:hypothetical protein
MPNAGHEINCMSCPRIEPFIVDMARGVTDDQDAQLARHILGCPGCAGLFEQERVMSAALRRLANDLREPAADPMREQALLAKFDQAVARPRPHRRAGVWTWTAAASVAVAGMLTWQLARKPSVPRIGTPPIAAVVPAAEQARALDSASIVAAAEAPTPPPGRSSGVQNADLRLEEASDSAEFVAWPGATAWPPFESGELIRIDIPTEVGVVQAEVLVGQDGFARAIRLIQ